MGALARKDTIDQMKKLRDMTKGTDVSDQISKITKKAYDGTNGAKAKNSLDGYIDSWEDHMKRQRKRLDDMNLKTFESFSKYSEINLILETIEKGEACPRIFENLSKLLDDLESINESNH